MFRAIAAQRAGALLVITGTVFAENFAADCQAYGQGTPHCDVCEHDVDRGGDPCVQRPD
jgi:hypothetical protein